MQHPPTNIPELNTLLVLWPSLSDAEQIQMFYSLPRDEADELFLRLSTADQYEILQEANMTQQRTWIRSLAPDDVSDLMQTATDLARDRYMELLDPPTRSEVRALLAYREDVAGGLMSTRFARLRPEMSVDEAIRYLRAQTDRNIETIYYSYVLSPTQKLLGVVSLRQLFTTPHEQKIETIMAVPPQMVTVLEGQHQEEIAQLFSGKGYLALPVVDADGIMKGIVTVDDVVSVVREEATEDIQKLGGMEVLDAPYLKIAFLSMVKKRGSWLLALFIGEMFTATAMGYYEREISKAVVLALFIPLIISSGGNSGSQASTLVIRAMALGEVRLRDWWRVMVRELCAGLALGVILGFVGLLRILFWPARESLYGEHYGLVAITVACSLIGIVMWGTLAGSMLPFILRKCRLDPATASAPAVATLVDVTGLIIYFTIASIVLHGTLL